MKKQNLPTNHYSSTEDIMFPDKRIAALLGDEDNDFAEDIPKDGIPLTDEELAELLSQPRRKINGGAKE